MSPAAVLVERLAGRRGAKEAEDVIRVRDGKAEWVDVMTGISTGPLVEVFGDLRAGDEVAARGTDEIHSGVQLRTKLAPPA